jgi:mRNA-degrading endonuclease toxin of MazEF toxin-antitoxin module
VAGLVEHVGVDVAGPRPCLLRSLDADKTYRTRTGVAALNQRKM